jgi:MFS family permease
MARPAFLRLLGQRNYALIWWGNTISRTGDQLQMVALGWLVNGMPDSVFKLGVLGFAQMAPRLLLSLVGGVVVDRLDRARLLMTTQFLAMLQAIAFAVLVASNRITFPQVIGLTAFLGVVNTVNMMARQTLLISMVPPEDIQPAVALDFMSGNLTTILGQLFGGVMLAAIGVSGCMTVNAVSFVAILGTLFALPRKQMRPGKSKGFGKEMVEGLRYVAGRELLWKPIAITFLTTTLIISITRLMPVFATMLGMKERGYGLLLGAVSMGALMGSSSSILSRRISFHYRVFAALSVACVALFVFSRVTHVYAAIPVLVVLGLAHTTTRTVAASTCQEACEDQFRGRVMSIFSLDQGLRGLGNLWLGWIGSLKGPTFGLACNAVLCLVLTSVVLLYGRDRARPPPPS